MQKVVCFFGVVATSQAQIYPEQIIEIGKEIYDAIKDNAPTLDIETDWAGAIPRGVDEWTDLENWKSPAISEPYYVEFKDFFKKLTRFEWNFVWKFGGDFNGTGHYVTQAGIQIKDAYSFLGEHLDVVVQSLEPINYGAKEDPVGGIDIQVSVSSHGSFEKTTKTCTMTVKGDGESKLGACEHGKFHALPPSEHSTDGCADVEDEAHCNFALLEGFCDAPAVPGNPSMAEVCLDTCGCCRSDVHPAYCPAKAVEYSV